jgi:glutathione S-transferase
MALKDAADTALSTLATFSRFGRGIRVEPAAVKPERPLELYEFEGCPYCRLVREALTELDLEAMVYPCPKGGERFRPKAIEIGGKRQFPLLVDPNTGQHMYESADIVAYLFETYGQRPLPMAWRMGIFNEASSFLATTYRVGAGTRAKPSRAPEQPLELYSFESSPFARRVRETLCELEIPYLLHNVGRTRAAEFIPPAIRDRLNIDVPVEGESRKAFVARSGRMMIPYLHDPNTGQGLFESGDIRRYLRQTYGDGA